MAKKNKSSKNNKGGFPPSKPALTKVNSSNNNDNDKNNNNFFVSFCTAFVVSCALLVFYHRSDPSAQWRSLSSSTKTANARNLVGVERDSENKKKKRNSSESGSVFVESSPVNSNRDDNNQNGMVAQPPSQTPEQSCDDSFRAMLLGEEAEADKKNGEEEDYFSFLFESDESFPVVVHRNGQANSCGSVPIRAFFDELRANHRRSGCAKELEKYTFESMMTETLMTVLEKDHDDDHHDSCVSEETYKRGSADDEGILGYCDMGEDHTPILLDHDKLVPVVRLNEKGEEVSRSLPCHFHTREGLRVTRLEQLSQIIDNAKQKRENGNGDSEANCKGEEDTQTCLSSSSHTGNDINVNGIHLYAVPAGRVFMFAPSKIGEVFYLDHVTGSSNQSIYLKVLSLQPRVFDIFHFFNREESRDLVERAIAETSATHKIKRSTTGASTVNTRRTSESGFDTSGKTALTVKRRCFDLLGFDEYIESHSDGLQILRYNVSKAYNSHLDWIADKESGEEKHDFQSAGTGGNRFATILLYMSDLGEHDGGETVFPRGIPTFLDDDGIPTQVPAGDRVTVVDARESLRSSEQGRVLRHGSWEEDLIVQCRTKLAVRPHSSRAVLFYSQHPNGEVDNHSLHGACPVLNDQKYAANLWVWNTPRSAYPGAPIKKKYQKESGSRIVSQDDLDSNSKKVSATFHNSGSDPTMDEAELYYVDQKWGSLAKGSEPLGVNTYRGHVWNVVVKGQTVKTWVISPVNGLVQKFVI